MRASPGPAAVGWRWLLLALLLVVCWLAFTPVPPPSVDTGWDKSNHLLAFGTLALCAERGFGAAAWRRIVAGLLGYGVFIELVQLQIPGRSSEAADVLADALGIALGLLLAAAWRRWQAHSVSH